LKKNSFLKYIKKLKEKPSDDANKNNNLNDTKDAKVEENNNNIFIKVKK